MDVALELLQGLELESKTARGDKKKKASGSKGRAAASGVREGRAPHRDGDPGPSASSRTSPSSLASGSTYTYAHSEKDKAALIRDISAALNTAKGNGEVGAGDKEGHRGGWGLQN